MAKSLKSQLKVEKDKRIVDGVIKTNPTGTHYKKYEYNIFHEKMKPEHLLAFMNADGNELKKKACAVASSSMLAYNFFHWIDREHPIKIAGVVYNHVEFERLFPCIKGRKCANMDVVLTNDDGDMLCIECKFTEHLENGSSKFADAYFIREMTDGIYWKELVEKYQVAEWYQGGLKQNISHLVALNRFVNEGRIDSNKIKFINVIFRPKIEFKEDFKHDTKYREELDGLKREVEAMRPELAVKLDRILSYREIYDAICSSDAPTGLIDYLKERYMEYHQ